MNQIRKPLFTSISLLGFSVLPAISQAAPILAGPAVPSQSASSITGFTVFNAPDLPLFSRLSPNASLAMDSSATPVAQAVAAGQSAAGAGSSLPGSRSPVESASELALAAAEAEMTSRFAEHLSSSDASDTTLRRSSGAMAVVLPMTYKNVPEPSSLALLTTGLVGVSGALRRRLRSS